MVVKIKIKGVERKWANIIMVLWIGVKKLMNDNIYYIILLIIRKYFNKKQYIYNIYIGVHIIIYYNSYLFFQISGCSYSFNNLSNSM